MIQMFKYWQHLLFNLSFLSYTKLLYLLHYPMFSKICLWNMKYTLLFHHIVFLLFFPVVWNYPQLSEDMDENFDDERICTVHLIFNLVYCVKLTAFHFSRSNVKFNVDISSLFIIMSWSQVDLTGLKIHCSMQKKHCIKIHFTTLGRVIKLILPLCCEVFKIHNFNFLVIFVNFWSYGR